MGGSTGHVLKGGAMKWVVVVEKPQENIAHLFIFEHPGGVGKETNSAPGFTHCRVRCKHMDGSSQTLKADSI